MPRIKAGGSGLGGALKNAGTKPRTRKQIQDRHTTEMGGDRHLSSVVERNDLDEFVANAMLEQRSFEVKYGELNLLPMQESDHPMRLHREIYDYGNLGIPRRPAWDDATTREELDAAERRSFLDWRRDLARISENSEMVVTPYEKNLDVWRQLWRVMERSHLVVQIVDARNPLLFLSRDLNSAVKELSTTKRTLVVVNKADFLSVYMRKCWAEYFKSQDLRFVFFSAKMEQARQEEEATAAAAAADADAAASPDTASADEDSSETAVTGDDEDTSDSKDNSAAFAPVSESIPEPEPKTEFDLLNTSELVEHFLASYRDGVPPSPAEDITVGLVGYPNVGKSSIINALMGKKKVGVAAMPGKTRHFQTLILRPGLTLCDCPGLVFPVFLSTKSDLVVNGILPIDRLREFVSPTALVCARVSVDQFHTAYGLRFGADSQDHIDARTLLLEFGRMRGFLTGRGLPDEHRCARHILKDFATGKLLYCHPPPNLGEEQRQVFYQSLVPPEAPAQRVNAPSSRPEPVIKPKEEPDAMLREVTERASSGMVFTGGSSKGGRKKVKVNRARVKAMTRLGKQL